MSNFINTLARLLSVGILMAFAACVSAQQDYPNRPIRLIVPFPPGGGTNTVARLVGQKLSESWVQPVVVDNRGGGNTVIGTEALVKSAPDGYTIILVSTAHVTTPLLISTPYDAIKDFAPIATVIKSELVLVLHPSVPASNLQEFIALAKSMPGKLNYATSGIGNPTHLATELFNIMAGVKTQHIPYKGSGPAVSDLLGGQVQLYFTIPINAVAHVKSGKLKAIAISGESRLSSLPQVPTFTEAGLPGYEVQGWFGLLAPAGTSKSIIDKLSGEVAAILAIPDVREKIVGQGLEPFIATPERFAALIRADFEKYGRIVKTANIKMEQ